MTRILSALFAFVLLAAACSFAPEATGVPDSAVTRAAVTYVEDFELSTASGTSYVSGSFVGRNGITWDYINTAWAGGVIAGEKSPVLGMNQSPVAEVSAVVPAGVGTLSFKFRKPYSTAVSLDVYVGMTRVGTVTASAKTKTTSILSSPVYTVNKAGAQTIRFVQTAATSGQVSIDTVTWTSYGDVASSSSVSSSSSVVSSSSSSSVVSSSSAAMTSTAEDFTACTATGTTYIDGSFVGNGGVTWNYVQTAWAGGDIEGKTPVLGKGRTPLSEISATIPNGIGTLSFKYRQPYSSLVSLDVYAGSTRLGTVTSSGSTTTVYEASFTVNVTGSVTLRFVQPSTTAGQVSIDNITWTTPGSVATSSSSSVAASSSSSAAPVSGAKIKIGSFNIEIFGTTKISRANTLRVLAQVATNYDIMAVQEVGSNSNPSESTATTVMETYIAEINSIAGPGAYSYVRGHQYAFVYRNSTINKHASQLYSGSQTFAYVPLVANFSVKSGNFDFSMISIHTSPSLANTEIPALKTVMSEVKALYNENDVICVGDYNADGSYYSAGTVTQGWLNGFDPSVYITAIKNGSDTTVSVNNTYTYDRMQMFTAYSTQDFTGTTGVLRFAEVYDISLCEGPSETGIEGNLSDHYPVWAEFYADRDTD